MENFMFSKSYHRWTLKQDIKSPSQLGGSKDTCYLTHFQTSAGTFPPKMFFCSDSISNLRCRCTWQIWATSAQIIHPHLVKILWKGKGHNCKACMFSSHFYSPSALHHSSVLVIHNITRTGSITMCISKTTLDLGFAAHLDCSITTSTVRPNNSITNQTLLYVKQFLCQRIPLFPDVSSRHLEN